MTTLNVRPTGAVVFAECEARIDGVCLVPTGPGPVFQFSGPNAEPHNICKSCAARRFATGEWSSSEDVTGHTRAQRDLRGFLGELSEAREPDDKQRVLAQHSDAEWTLQIPIVAGDIDDERGLFVANVDFPLSGSVRIALSSDDYSTPRIEKVRPATPAEYAATGAVLFSTKRTKA